MMSRRLKIAMACAVFLGVYLVIRLMVSQIVSATSVTSPGLTVLSNLYPATIFWILIWLSRAHVDEPVFSEAEAGKLILSFGVVLLLFAQGPELFHPVWLWRDALFKGAPWLFFNTYPIGWCFLLAGMFRWPAVRSMLLYGRPGITALVISLVWFVAGSLQLEFAPFSTGWDIAKNLSVFVALCGILSAKVSERKFAIYGLILMSVYSYYGGKFGGVVWFLSNPLTDFMVGRLVLLIGLLAWMAVVLQVTGLSRRLGIAYNE